MVIVGLFRNRDGGFVRDMRNAMLVAACAGVMMMVPVGAGAQQLGPQDGADLSPTDLERVGIGDIAPDFTLEAPLDGDVIRLSQYRGSKNVVLVFYRGHW